MNTIKECYTVYGEGAIRLDLPAAARNEKFQKAIHKLDQLEIKGMNKRNKHLNQLSQHMSDLASGKRKPKDKLQCIYNELSDYIGDSGVVSDALDIIKTWPEHSGKHMFPVTLGEDPWDEYFDPNRKSLWSGEYGDKMKKLCKYVSKELIKLKEDFE